ncbi:MAG: DUF1223 domain-containing protein [Rhodospirillaceae bacterium]|nr:DUF1223 domain-containing protein [Rhodospirillaceae bacterium]
MRLPVIVAVLSALGAPAAAQPTVVELFTSQSCSSCPPAEAYLGELADRPDLVALEWHVDYWDDLVYGFAGRWRDVFSDPAFTERQRIYNRQIRGLAQVYTPQMVIGGRAEAVGTRTGRVEAAIADAAGRDGAAASVTVTRGEGRLLQIAVDGAAVGPASVWLVRLITREATDVGGGENHGRRLENHNVVIGIDRLGDWAGGPARLTAPMPSGRADRCAVLVQTDGQGPILAAAYCPGLG